VDAKLRDVLLHPLRLLLNATPRDTNAMFWDHSHRFSGYNIRVPNRPFVVLDQRRND
jgi:hypothetical protein